MNLLIAEDDPVARRMLEATLTGLGHQTTSTANGEEAWSVWRVSQSRVIISDWLMPVVDGLELCRRIRARHGDPYTYFILLTARVDRQSYLSAMDAGIDDFLTKPLDGAELTARLTVAQRILGLREELHALEGLLPICSYCKRIRDDAQQWSSLERYIEARSQAEFSHGVCPDCYAKYVQPQLDKLGTG